MKKVMIVAVLVILASCLWAQSNEMLDSFLDAETADTATSLLLVAQAAGKLTTDSDPAAGYAWAMEQEFGKHVAKLEPGEPITLGVFYLALLKSFDVRGGIWFKSVGNPRYATLEAGYMGYVEPSRLYYTRSMAPYEVLTGITYVVSDKEEGTL